MCARLVLLGGGHANLPLIANIPRMVDRGHSVTCVSLQPVHYYSGMGPGMLGGTYTPGEIRFPIRDLVRDGGGQFVQARATRIDAPGRIVELESGEALPYDVLCVNTGSTIASTARIRLPDGAVGPRVFPVKPIEHLAELRSCVTDMLRSGKPRIAVVGGGPAAVEIAANLMRIAREAGGAAMMERAEVHLITGRSLLPGFPRSAERKSLAALVENGVVIRPGERLEEITEAGITVDGRSEHADVVVLATGVIPSRLFADSGLPLGDDGSLAVNQYLHMLGDRRVFGGGDCIWFTPKPLPRAGVFAVREGPVLVHNVTATLEHGTSARLRPFAPGGAYLLLLNFGDDTALFWRRIAGVHVVYRSRRAFRLKDRIDMKFMHRFGSETDRQGGTSVT